MANCTDFSSLTQILWFQNFSFWAQIDCWSLLLCQDYFLISHNVSRIIIVKYWLLGVCSANVEKTSVLSLWLAVVGFRGMVFSDWLCPQAELTRSGDTPNRYFLSVFVCWDYPANIVIIVLSLLHAVLMFNNYLKYSSDEIEMSMAGRRTSNGYKNGSNSKLIVPSQSVCVMRGRGSWLKTLEYLVYHQQSS